MGEVQTQAKVQKSSLRAVVTRKDGTVENRGLIRFTHPNPFINFTVNVWVRVNAWRWARYERAYYKRVHGIDLRKVAT